MLVIGYGNPGRGDDGLGPAFADRIAAMHLPGVEVLADFQLKAEHALQVAEAESVVFVDADMTRQDGFALDPVCPSENGDISSHALSPQTVLALAQTLLGAVPAAYLLAIGGQNFGRIEEGLSAPATRNLEAALDHFLHWHAGQAA